MNRRSFVKKGLMAGLASSLAPLTTMAIPEVMTKNEVIGRNDDTTVLPTPQQKAWMDLKFGMFIHWGVNTYHDKEWSDGTLDISVVNASRLDTDQWCRVAKSAGMKYIVPVVKHHDGFCIWETPTTTYSISHTPTKKDVLAELANSAAKHGLKLGLYYSLWDRHEKSHDTNEALYVEFMKKQLEELLTGYGEIVEIWFDGFWKKQQSGWTKKISDETGEKVDAANKLRDEEFINAWRMEGAFRWQIDHVYQFIKQLQPDCLVMNNSTTAYPGVPLHPVDIRSGEKYTSPKNDRKVWSWLGKEQYLPLQIETTLSTKGNDQFPSGNWFWHEWDRSVLSKEQVLSYLKTAEIMRANLLLNCGPDPSGKLRDLDVKVLGSL